MASFMVTIMKIINKLSRAWEYFKFGYRDVDYDYSGVYELLKIKLSRLEEHIRTHDRHTTAQSDAKDIRIVLALIDSLEFDSKVSNADERFKEITGEEFEYILGDTSITCNLPRYRKLYVNLAGEQATAKQHNKKLLFKILGKKLDKWWC